MSPLRAESGDLFGHDEMRFTRRAIRGTHASLQFVGTQDVISFGDIALAMHPLGLNRVKPGTFRGQQARQDADALARLLHGLIVAAHPAPNDLTLMPGRVIPDEHQDRNGLCLELLAALFKKVDGHGTDGTAIDKAQKHLVTRLVMVAQQHSITGQGFRIRILFAPFELLEPRPVIFHPAVLLGLSQSAPPDLIKETEHPTGMSQHQTDQAIPTFFFLT